MEEVEKILNKIADVEDIKNYEIKGDDNPLRGDGFLGEFYTGSVRNKETGETIYTYIKKLPNRHDPYAPSAFFNEFQYYKNIVPELKKFLKESNIKTPFTNIPRFYCAGNEPGKEYISMENLKVQNYNILDKSESINGELLKVIFDKYGRYHALTFAFKDQNPEKYRELVSPLRDLYVEFAETGGFLTALKGSFYGSYSALKDRDEETAQKIQPYLENLTEHYKKIMVYDGQHSALVHGDCWSNNLLFKFTEDGTLEDIKFIDFQLCRNSTPIHDLSYFFYSGASKEDFDKVDEYLEIYHKSFSAFAKELGSDPEKLLPLNVFKSEWKKHSRLGIFMGIVLWQVKLMQRENIEAITTGKAKEDPAGSFAGMLQNPIFKKNTSDILIHAVEYGIL